jgi:hypothetical protein
MDAATTVLWVDGEEPGRSQVGRSVLMAGGYASVDPEPTTETALRYR